MARDVRELYETDFVAWTGEQAAALRDLARSRWDGPLDLEHLAEEVEDLGAAQRAAVLSQIERLIQHLLKLEHSGLRQPRNGWLNSVDSARGDIERRLTASLRIAVEGALPRLYGRARRAALRDLLDYSEAAFAENLPEENPYTLDRLLDESWYPANRRGLS
jgi:hypothetical protein